MSTIKEIIQKAKEYLYQINPLGSVAFITQVKEGHPEWEIRCLVPEPNTGTGGFLWKEKILIYNSETEEVKELAYVSH